MRSLVLAYLMSMKTKRGLATEANWGTEVKDLALVMKTPHLHGGGVRGKRAVKQGE